MDTTDIELQAKIDRMRESMAEGRRLFFGPREKPKRRVPKVRHREWAELEAKVEALIAHVVAQHEALDATERALSRETPTATRH